MNQHGVVVGVDRTAASTAASTAALRWAVSEAIMRSLPLTVCHVGRLPYGQKTGPDAASLAEIPGPDAASEGVRLARQIGPSVTVHSCHREGAPADVLLQIAEECELLVLGVRGAGA